MWTPTHVQVTVHKAKRLLQKGKGGKNDAYVTIQLGKEKYQTSVKERAESPEWHEECDLPIPDMSENIVLNVYNRSFLGLDDFLGHVKVPLNQFQIYERPRSRWYTLLTKPGKKDEKDRGELEIKVTFIVQSKTENQSPNVKIGRAGSIKNLATAMGEKLKKPSRSNSTHSENLTDEHEGSAEKKLLSSSVQAISGKTKHKTESVDENATASEIEDDNQNTSQSIAVSQSSENVEELQQIGQTEEAGPLNSKDFTQKLFDGEQSVETETLSDFNENSSTAPPKPPRKMPDGSEDKSDNSATVSSLAGSQEPHTQEVLMRARSHNSIEGLDEQFDMLDSAGSENSGSSEKDQFQHIHMPADLPELHELDASNPFNTESENKSIFFENQLQDTTEDTSNTLEEAFKQDNHDNVDLFTAKVNEEEILSTEKEDAIFECNMNISDEKKQEENIVDFFMSSEVTENVLSIAGTSSTENVKDMDDPLLNIGIEDITADVNSKSTKEGSKVKPKSNPPIIIVDDGVTFMKFVNEIPKKKKVPTATLR